MRATRQIENREILTVFRQLAESNKDVRLLNVYKGVPVSYEAKIIEVAEPSALFRTEKTQLVCLNHEGKTHIQSLFLPKIVYAVVQDIDVHRNESVLGDFEYVSGRIGARTQVRVIPERTINGIFQLEDSDKTCEGEVADISLDGLGFYTAREIQHPECLRKGAKVRINLPLPGRRKKKLDGGKPADQGDLPMRHHTIRLEGEDLPCLEQVDWLSQEETRSVTLSGEIMNFHEEVLQQRWRIGVRIDPFDPHKAEISHYITHRQAEIMREIRDLYEKRNQRKPEG